MKSNPWMFTKSNCLMSISLFTIGMLIVSPFMSMASIGTEKEVVALSQVPGEFTTTELKLKAGKPYVFEVTNLSVDHPVALVVAPLGTKKLKKKDHIKEAYLSNTVLRGESSRSQAVILQTGEYAYWCPLNPTQKYKLTVE